MSHWNPIFTKKVIVILSCYHQRPCFVLFSILLSSPTTILSIMKEYQICPTLQLLPLCALANDSNVE